MADADRDGELSRREFAVAMHLAACVAGKKKLPMPRTLPPCLMSITDYTGSTTEPAAPDDAKNTTAPAIKTALDSQKIVSESATSGVRGKEGGSNSQKKNEATMNVKRRKDSTKSLNDSEKGRKESTQTREPSGEGHVEEEGLEYQMSEKQMLQYHRAFDKLISGGSDNLGGKEVRFACVAVRGIGWKSKRK